MTKERTVLDENGDEIVIDVPCHWEICSTCRGNGKHSHDLGAITSSEWEEWDYDERDTYMAGGYDRTCEDCNGTGKVQEEDYSSLPANERKLLEDSDREEADYQRECKAERDFGC